jgi:hypothetical protein
VICRDDEDERVTAQRKMIAQLETESAASMARQSTEHVTSMARR